MRRWGALQRHGLLVAGVVLCLLDVVVALRALRTPAVDLAVYRAGARTVLDGIPLYRQPVNAGLDFTYPPLAALVFVPLALLPSGVAAAVVCVANLVLLGCVCHRSLVALGMPRDRQLIAATLLAAGLTFWLDPVRTTIYIGQINLLLMALVLWDLLRDKGARAQGVGVGIAAGLKLTPLVFIPYLLFTRRFRAAIVATATFLGTIAIGFAILPSDARDYWLGGRFAQADRVYPDPATPHNQSLYGLIARIHGPYVLWLLLALAVLVVAPWFAAKVDDRLLAITLCGLAASVISPYSWNHHWVWLVPLAVFLAVRRQTVWLLPLMVVFLPWIADLANPPTGSPKVVGPAAFPLDNAYVLYFAIVVAVLVWRLRSKPVG